MSFLRGDFDLLVAARIASQQSWMNPVERIMSILNLGLQGVIIVHESMSNKMEILFNKYGNLEEIRQAAKKNSQLEIELKNSIIVIQELLNSRTERLILNENKFACKSSATSGEIEAFFEVKFKNF